MRNSLRLFCTRTKFQYPLLYFMSGNHIVSPVGSIDDFCKSTIRRKAFILETPAQRQQPVVNIDQRWYMKKSEGMLIDELRKQESFYPDHPVLSSVLTQLAMYYLMQKKLDEAQKFMERAVELRCLSADGTDFLPLVTNLAIINYLKGDKDYCKKKFEFCVEGWYEHASEPYRIHSIDALPYFYNFLIMGNHDTEFFEKARHDFLNLILPTLALNNKHPFYTICNELRERLQQPALCQRVPTSMQYRA